MENDDNVRVDANEKKLLSDDIDHGGSGIEIGHMILAYAILFLCIMVFAPKIYLANNVYYLSKEINDLKSIKEALKVENAELQRRLESVKFNFLTLEIEEIQ